MGETVRTGNIVWLGIHLFFTIYVLHHFEKSWKRVCIFWYDAWSWSLSSRRRTDSNTPTLLTQSIPWLLETRQCKEVGYQKTLHIFHVMYPCYPGYFREPYWLSMGLPELSKINGQVCVLYTADGLSFSHRWSCVVSCHRVTVDMAATVCPMPETAELIVCHSERQSFSGLLVTYNHSSNPLPKHNPYTLISSKTQERCKKY